MDKKNILLGISLFGALSVSAQSLGTAETSSDDVQVVRRINSLNAYTPTDLLRAIVNLAKNEGVNTSDAESVLASGRGDDEVNKAIEALRIARKQFHFETDNATYTGNEPFEGRFYLYNVGRKNYLSSGSDWGTHFALGYPGLELTSTPSGNGYTFRFAELNGNARDQTMTDGYVDGETGWAVTYVFEPIAGKQGVYALKNANDNTYLGLDANAELEGKKYFDTVTSFLPNANSEDAQWIIVTKEERLAQIEKASADNPVDVSFIIRDASFNKFADLNNPWRYLNQGWEYDNREFGDKNTETYNVQDYELAQSVTLPKAGDYELSVQAYYRDGSIEAHVKRVQEGSKLMEAPVLFAGFEEQPLCYIHEYADQAPGEGTDTAIGNFPDNMLQASKFFENGLYKNTLTFSVKADNTAVTIGIYKDTGNREGNWIVADNFRLKYLGNPNATGIVNVRNNADDEAAETVYNLYGQRVAKSQKGFAVKGGKKYIVR